MNIKTTISTLREFRKEEDGLALTEYLILLGLLTGAVIASVILFGDGLAEGWRLWAAWIGEGTELGGPATALGG